MVEHLVIKDATLQGALSNVRMAQTAFSAEDVRCSNLADAVGSDVVAKALGDFASQWSVRREKLGQTLQDLGDKLQLSMDTFAAVDQAIEASADKLGSSLPSMGGSGVSTGPSGGVTVSGGGGGGATGGGTASSGPGVHAESPAPHLPPAVPPVDPGHGVNHPDPDPPSPLPPFTPGDPIIDVIDRLTQAVKGWESLSPAEQSLLFTSIGIAGLTLLVRAGRLPVSVLDAVSAPVRPGEAPDPLPPYHLFDPPIRGPQPTLPFIPLPIDDPAPIPEFDGPPGEINPPLPGEDPLPGGEIGRFPDAPPTDPGGVGTELPPGGSPSLPPVGAGGGSSMPVGGGAQLPPMPDLPAFDQPSPADGSTRLTSEGLGNVAASALGGVTAGGLAVGASMGGGTAPAAPSVPAASLPIPPSGRVSDGTALGMAAGHGMASLSSAMSAGSGAGIGSAVGTGMGAGTAGTNAPPGGKAAYEAKVREATKALEDLRDGKKDES